MNKIRKAFSNGKAFIPLITGGDPDLETTEKLLFALSEAGADLIEIGIPFSDPVAEGPVIEAADERALNAGCTVDKLFNLVAGVHGKIKAPLLFMTYYNPVFAYGVERFTSSCAACGIEGLIVPDLPFEERDELLAPCRAKGLELISIIAPTSKSRIAKIAKNSSGFLYCISGPGEPGDQQARRITEQAKAAGDTSCALDADVSGPEQARAAAQYADGVIVGSAMVRLAEEYGRDCVEPVFALAKSIKQAICWQYPSTRV